MDGILKIGETNFSIKRSEFRYIEDTGEGTCGWEFNIETDEAGNLLEDHHLYGETVRFYSEGDPIPIPLKEDLTGVEVVMDEPFDYWKLPFCERLRAEIWRTLFNKPFEASKRAKNHVYFTLYVFEHTSLNYVSLKFTERKIQNDNDFYRVLISAKIPKGAVESYEEDLMIDAWIKRLPNGSYVK